MGTCGYLEVDVNGEEVFFVDKKIISYFSGKFSNLFGKLRGKTRHLKVIFLDFPGGAEGFELIVRYCHNNGKIVITPSNIFLLHCAANFMEIKKNTLALSDLEIEKYLEAIPCWTWSELLSSLKQCQDLYTAISSSNFLEKYLNLFVGWLCSVNIGSPYTYSSEISNSQLLSDSSSDSMKSYLSQASWWFEDLVFLNLYLFEKVVHTMISQGYDHTTVCKFLFYYGRTKLVSVSFTKKRKIVETVINLLFLLDRSSISSRGLFGIFRLAMCLKISNVCKKKLEALIGSKLGEATIDDLFVPSPCGKKHRYDVNLILRLLKLFCAENQFMSYPLKKVAFLMDLYLAEVAPDPHLRPSKFVKLATAIPDFARDSNDRIYQAIDTYLKVHCILCHEEKMKICSILNFNMHSKKALIDVAKDCMPQPGSQWRMQKVVC